MAENHISHIKVRDKKKTLYKKLTEKEYKVMGVGDRTGNYSLSQRES